MSAGHRAFFGDAERVFIIRPEFIPELEEKTGAGIGALCRRLFAGEFRHADITETIRIAMIGGGEAPARAASLVATYAAMPLTETYSLAVAILEDLWFRPKPEPKEGADEPAA